VNEENLIEAHRKLDAIAQDLKEANEKLDKLLCPWGNEGPDFTVIGAGCDGIDQDCNGKVDDCNEDNVAPSIELKNCTPVLPFKSIEEAIAYLTANIQVTDDCATDISTSITLLSELNCCECTFQVTATDQRCTGQNPMANASKNFILKVDSKAPVITCGFFTQQDPHHVSGGFDPCAGLPVPYPGTDDPLHIDRDCFAQDHVNAAFWYQIEVSVIFETLHLISVLTHTHQAVSAVNCLF